MVVVKVVLIVIFSLSLLSCTAKKNCLINEPKKVDEQKIIEVNKQYSKINFQDGIDKSEAKAIISKHFLEEGLLFSTTQFNPEPSDVDDKWVFDVVGCFSWSKVIVDKKTGQILSEK